MAPRLALAVLLLGFALQAAANEHNLMCQGRMSSTNRPDMTQTAIEFTLDYAEGMQVAAFKSNFDALNGPLVFQLDDAFLRAKQSQPRPLGGEGRSISVSDLRVSRETGRFTLAVALFRDIDFPDGGVLWEGVCQPRQTTARRF